MTTKTPVHGTDLYVEETQELGGAWRITLYGPAGMLDRRRDVDASRVGRVRSDMINGFVRTVLFDAETGECLARSTMRRGSPEERAWVMRWKSGRRRRGLSGVRTGMEEK